MTIVFTAILGDCDSLKLAPKGADRCVCFVDDLSRFTNANGWELQAAPLSRADARRSAWYLRCVPHILFPGYSRVVWIDASFTLTDLPRLLKDAGEAPIAALRHHNRSSCYAEGKILVKVRQAKEHHIRPQLDHYLRSGFNPSHLSISCIIVRDHSATAERFNTTWARQIDAYLGDNTQVSLDYSAWVNGTEIRALKGTRHDNPYSTHDHLDHKKRRRPYWVPA